MESKTLFDGIKHEEEDGQEGDSGHITGKSLFKQIKQQHYRCHLSGIVLDVCDASVDHIIPLSRGGTNTMDNVAIVHATINRMKGTMTDAEFASWCIKVAEWNR